MSGPEVELGSTGVTLVGHFNPAIISPAWLLLQKLISGEDFGEAIPRLITPDVSNFELPWMHCQVVSDRLQMSTTDASETERLRDLIIGVLQALPHTPLAAMGINHEAHFKVGSLAEWHAVGHSLAPKAPWTDLLKAPGMKHLTLWSERTDDEAGRVQIDVEPSVRIVPFGIYVAVNDHFELAPSKDSEALDIWESSETRLLEPSADKAGSAIQILSRHWVASRRFADDVVSRVWSQRTSREGETTT